MVLLHPISFGNEVWNSPRLDPHSAKLFRRALVIQSLLTTTVMSASYWYGNRTGPGGSASILFGIEVGAMTAVEVFLLIATDLIQEDAWQRAMNHYACAPLATLPFVGVATAIVSLIGFPLSSFAVIAAILVWCLVSQVLVAHPVKNSPMTTAGTMAVMLIVWVVLAGASILCGLAIGGLASVVFSQW
jgi:hypothetical protein